MENKLFNLLLHSNGKRVDDTWRAVSTGYYRGFIDAVRPKPMVMYITAMQDAELEVYRLALSYLASSKAGDHTASKLKDMTDRQFPLHLEAGSPWTIALLS